MFILFVDTIKKVRTSYISYFVEIYSALFHLELSRFINENFHCLSRINITTEICQLFQVSRFTRNNQHFVTSTSILKMNLIVQSGI